MFLRPQSGRIRDSLDRFTPRERDRQASLLLEETIVSVRIRMKKMGRTHRSFFRICATDKRSPRDGRVLEELGTYDPSIPDTDARAILKRDRIDYWLSVGAQPSDAAKSLIRNSRLSGEDYSFGRKCTRS